MRNLMSDECIIRNCAPTLAGLKTGSLFSCTCSSRDQLFSFVRQLNIRLSPKGIRVIPMRFSEYNALIYLYRPSMLEIDLSRKAASDLLKRCGYATGNSEKCLSQLIKRIRRDEGFPHEIGLFLGYPPEDVRGFMDNNAHFFKCSGYWKVYSNDEAAKQKFEQYKKCTQFYQDQWISGKSMEYLTITI